jgi:hypothetical protein
VTINNGIKKFGTGSLSFNATTNSYLTTPTSANYSFGSGDFTIEFWLYITNIADQPRIVGNSTGTWATKNWTFLVNSSQSAIGFAIFDNSWSILSSVSIANNTWYHVAFSRLSNTGYMSVNGIVNSLALAGAIDAGTNYMNIGWNGISVDKKLNGYIDDLRITKGIARYTSNFVVPGFAFPDARGTMVEWPPAALTGASTPLSSQAYGNGTFTVTESSQFSGAEGWRCFNKPDITNTTGVWATQTGSYSQSTGTYLLSASTSGGLSGEWVQLQLPVAVTVVSFTLTSVTFTSDIFSASPSTVVLYGSNNGTVWTALASPSAQTWTTNGEVKAFSVPSPAAYSFYRLVTNKLMAPNLDGILRLGELRLFGY